MKARKRKTHFVPKVVYQTAFAGVVPLCVAGLACSSSSGSTGPQGSVACSGFCGVAQAAFIDAGDASDAVAPADGATTGDGATDASCYCCTNNCGVGVAAFADSGDTG